MTEPDDEDRERFQLSAAQVAASSLAAMSAAVVCSYFGVAGTVIGTAVTSLIATTGSALYSYSLRRTKARLRRLHLAGAASPPIGEVFKTARTQSREMFRQVPWKALALGAAIVFIFSMGVITAIEESQGETIAALLHVSHRSDRRTSLGGSFSIGHHSKHHKAKPKVHPSKTPSPTATPTSTAVPSTTPTATPSTTPTASTSPTVTSTPTGLLGSLLPSPTATSTK